MKLSVVIPCYNAGNTIGIQLEALANQNWNELWEVIIVNNRSTDDSMKIAERFRNRFPQMRIVDASAKQGRPYAYNVGAAAAQGDSICFCDADDEVAPGWLAAMGEALSKYLFVACRVDIQKLNAPWLYAAIAEHPQEKGLMKIDYPPYLFHAGCGTIGIKRLLHEAIGGFDESFPVLQETDYCFKFQLAGVKMYFVPYAVLHIRFRTKLTEIYRQGREWAEYNVKLYNKYRILYGKEIQQPWKLYLLKWKKIIKQIPRIRGKREIASMIWELSWQIGKLQGSIKYRSHPVP